MKEGEDDDFNEEEEDADIEEFIKNDDDDADSIDNLNVQRLKKNTKSKRA